MGIIVIVLVVVGCLLFGLIGFKAYARERRDDYPHNLDSYEAYAHVKDPRFSGAMRYHGRNRECKYD